jgi:uncharacterized membrane protein
MADNQGPEHALERLIFFSDAVFAIAITLLIIEIHVPDLPRGSPDGAYFEALAHLIPSFIGYIVSFAVIGLFWMGHHRSFGLAVRQGPGIVGWNLALLGTIAFMPFSTAFLSAHVGDRVPTVFYCGFMLLTALLNVRVGRIVTSPPMVGPDVPPERIQMVRRRSLGVLLGAATAFVTSFFVPYAGQAALMTIPIWQLILLRGVGKRESEDA